MTFSIEDIQKICSPENIEITLHAAKRLEQRGISLNDVIECIKGGKIIEYYTDDYPFPSCLILGMSVSEQHIHVVVGSDFKTLWIVTAYYPDPTKWESDYATRKEKNI